MIAGGDDGNINILHNGNRWPNSIGLFYTAITAYLGWKPHYDEGIVMGLAPYGDDNEIIPEYNRTYRIDMLREVTVVDTLGFVSVKDSLFGEDERYKMMANVPIKGSDAKFSIQADIIDKNGYQVPVFEVKVKKDIILL